MTRPVYLDYEYWLAAADSSILEEAGFHGLPVFF
jgi:hypothetical protein